MVITRQPQLNPNFWLFWLFLSPNFCKRTPNDVKVPAKSMLYQLRKILKIHEHGTFFVLAALLKKNRVFETSILF